MKDRETPLLIDIRSQLIARQLHNLYLFAPKVWPNNHIPTFANYDMLYDLVVAEHDMGFSAEEKKNYWKLAKEKFKEFHPRWIKHENKEFIDNHLQKLYKTILVRQFILNKLFTEGIKLRLETEHGPVRLIDFAAPHERT